MNGIVDIATNRYKFNILMTYFPHLVSHEDHKLIINLLLVSLVIFFILNDLQPINSTH
jgi:hypothetical protein